MIRVAGVIFGIVLFAALVFVFLQAQIQPMQCQSTGGLYSPAPTGSVGPCPSGFGS